MSRSGRNAPFAVICGRYVAPPGAAPRGKQAITVSQSDDATAQPAEHPLHAHPPSPEIEWWRCRNCRRRWQSRGAPKPSRLQAWVRRRARQHARNQGDPYPAWATPRGAGRCPTCLSTDVRPSRVQAASGRPTGEATPDTTPPPANRRTKPTKTKDKRPPRRILRATLAAAATLIVALIALAAIRLTQAAHAGSAGERALIEAVALMTPPDGFQGLDSHTIDEVDAQLTAARHDFQAMHNDLAGAGPAYAVAQHIPFVRVQIRGIGEIDTVGGELTTAGQQLAATAKTFLAPTNANTSLDHGNVISALRTLQTEAAQASDALEQAAQHLGTLNGYRLVGALSTARKTLVDKLPALEQRALDAKDGLQAFLAFAGADGPRHYLVLSQNPDEVRPTGGYMGSYGLITADRGHLNVSQYGDTNAWIAAHPNAVVPESAAPTVFKLANSDETLADTNAVPDWPTAAQQAISLWRKGGGRPVDGVLSFTPDFLARLVAVLGPIPVPEYGDTVTGSNLVRLTDYWTHHAPTQPVAGGRKEFLSVLAPLVMHKLAAEPASAWPHLAAAVAAGFADQEAMLWSADSTVQQVVDAHHWAYQLPQTSGDFYADSEFEFAAKNGRGLRRSFDHTVTIRPDGSGVARTVMTLHDTEPPAPGSNPRAAGYFTPYGPTDATLTPASTKPLSTDDPDVDGHPTAGFVVSAPPGGQARLRVVWSVPHLLTPLGAHRYAYDLTWLPTPSHTGDVVHLRVTLPSGWHWEGTPPPTTMRVQAVTHGRWVVEGPS